MFEIIVYYYYSNLLAHDLHSKNESTIKFASKLIDIVNYIVMNICLMTFVNNTFLDHFITFCATVLHSKKYTQVPFFTNNLF